MTDYRRNRVPGGTFFFTVNLYDRSSELLIQHIGVLRKAIAQIKATAPFHIDAWVVLPDHLHCLWTLPHGDLDFSLRWRAIRSAFSRNAGPLMEDFKAGNITGLKLTYAASTGLLPIAPSVGAAIATLKFQTATLGLGAFHTATDNTAGMLRTHS